MVARDAVNRVLLCGGLGLPLTRAWPFCRDPRGEQAYGHNRD